MPGHEGHSRAARLTRSDTGIKGDRDGQAIEHVEIGHAEGSRVFDPNLPSRPSSARTRMVCADAASISRTISPVGSRNVVSWKIWSSVRNRPADPFAWSGSVVNNHPSSSWPCPPSMASTTVAASARVMRDFCCKAARSRRSTTALAVDSDRSMRRATY
jgi:hypothetical protein